MPRRTYKERDRAYRRRMQRKADESREELEGLAEKFHQEWAEQHHASNQAKSKRGDRRRSHQPKPPSPEPTE